MALTIHEKIHLNAMLDEITDNKTQPNNIKEKLAESKKTTLVLYESWLDSVKTEVDKIFVADTFPELDRPSDIHDFLEKD
jgi:hypothetical protein